MDAEQKARDAALGEDLAHHCAVSRGEYCAVCYRFNGDPLPVRGLYLCRWCWPDAAVPWHSLMISLMWNERDGWILCFGNRTAEYKGTKVGLWLLLSDRRDCDAVMERYLCSKADLAAFAGMSDRSGHSTIAIFVTPRRLAALVEATRRDPRTVYDKLKALGRR